MEWISVKNRLPNKEHQEVLVWLEDSTSCENATFIDSDFKYYDYDFSSLRKFWNYDKSRCKVTHWMPLPEKPKE